MAKEKIATQRELLQKEVSETLSFIASKGETRNVLNMSSDESKNADSYEWESLLDSIYEMVIAFADKKGFKHD